MLPAEYSRRLIEPSDVEAYVDWLMSIIGADESILSLVPEADPSSRRSRLRNDCESLLQRFPDPHERPELFAVPVGIKDIINVDGLATRAGSALPATAFSGPQAGAVSVLLLPSWRESAPAVRPGTYARETPAPDIAPPLHSSRNRAESPGRRRGPASSV